MFQTDVFRETRMIILPMYINVLSQTVFLIRGVR